MSGHILNIAKDERMHALLGHFLRQKDYQVSDARNGLEAVRLLPSATPNLILIDQDVEMGGLRTAHLLRLHPRYQRVPIVLIVDRDCDVEALKKEGESVHLSSFLHKPFSGAELEKTTVDNLRLELPPLSIDNLRTSLLKLTHLPVLEPNHRKMLSLLSPEDARVDIPQLVRAVELDQGMTTAVMHICNSAYYGFRGNSIQGAITFLGIDKLRKIVQSVIVFDAFGPRDDKDLHDGFSINSLWKHSLACGVIMEKGGQMVRGRGHFIAGMLHDIGKFIIYLRFPEYFHEVLCIVREEGKSMYQAERELIGITHADFGYELARKWDLPPTIANAIAHHHHPSQALQHKRLASLVHLSDILARTLSIGHGGDRKKIRMDDVAAPLAKYVLAVARDKDRIAQEVEAMVSA